MTTVAVAVNNTGTVDVSSGTLAFGQAVSGAGTFVLDGTAVLDLVGGAASGSAMTFLHPGGTLETAALGTFGAVVSGFASGDEIDVAGVGFVSGTTTVGFSGGTLTVSGGGQSASFALAGSYAAGAFTIGSDGHGGTGVGFPDCPPIVRRTGSARVRLGRFPTPGHSPPCTVPLTPT